MSTLEIVGVVGLIIALINGAMLPVILYFVAASAKARARREEAVDRKLAHLDSCLDELKMHVADLKTTIAPVLDTKAEIASMISTARAITTAEFGRLDSRLTQDTGGLEARIRRLEDLAMRPLVEARGG